MVDDHYPGVEVPQSFVTDGQIVLNIAPRAVSNFEMNNDYVQLSTRFSGMPIDIYLPVGAVMGVYAQENGQGMGFESENPDDNPPPQPPSGPKTGLSAAEKTATPIKEKSKRKVKPSLRVVK